MLLFQVGFAPWCGAGHQVLIEEGAGVGSGIRDEDFRAAGAVLCPREEVFGNSELIMKVKEPLPQEWPLLRPGQILYAFLHLAAAPELAHALLERQVSAIALETIQTADGALPLLVPMSEIAGRMAIHVGAKCLEKASGGRGVLLSGVPGVEPGRVAIVGGGIVGRNAARLACGMGAEVTLLDINLERLRAIDDIFRGRVKTLISHPEHLQAAVTEADLVIGAALVPGARTPHLIDRAMVRQMQPGAVLVDVSIDQGGCAETSRPTTHSQPTYIVDGVVHYCVPNMPGAVARTATYALANVTLPYALQLANKGLRQALADDPALCKGLNLHRGQVTHPAVAASLGLPYHPYHA
ncbi:MAG: alanine dehydrogenase [Candidatus Tectimicrobiota bacterium]|nr:MAG: alanine dehydrogenase [Candidatus Tectomicrobia bacterium]